MWHNIRFRLLVSLIVPALILIPLMGLALVYFLEQRVFLPTLAKETTAEGRVIAGILRESPQVWDQPASAQKVIDRLHLPASQELVLLDSQSRRLASRSAGDKVVPGSGGSPAPAGIMPTEARWQIIAQAPGHAPVLNIIIPVTGPDQRAYGTLHLYRPLVDLNDGLRAARMWILAALLAALAANAGLAFLLAGQITYPLQQITQAITALAQDDQPGPAGHSGLAEIDSLSRATSRLHEQLRDNEHTRRQMLANLVHEIGRPLGGLQAAAHALKRGAEMNMPLRLDLLNGMDERIEWLGHLTADLALVYHAQNALKLRILPVHPGEWLRSLAPLWAEMALQKGIQWQAGWPDDLPVIQADAERLEQALGNLVSNAIKFTPTGGSISLSAGVESFPDGTKANRFWAMVTDTGPGIDAEALPHVFEPFFRGGATAQISPGSGLGLSIAKTIAEAHGGEINVTSRPGEGTRFTLSIPCHS